MQKISTSFSQKLGQKLLVESKNLLKRLTFTSKKLAFYNLNILNINELKEAFSSLQTRKSSGHDEISFNVFKSCFGYLSKPLLHIFRLSLEKGISPDD